MSVFIGRASDTLLKEMGKLQIYDQRKIKMKSLVNVEVDNYLKLVQSVIDVVTEKERKSFNLMEEGGIKCSYKLIKSKVNKERLEQRRLLELRRKELEEKERLDEEKRRARLFQMEKYKNILKG